ncbi:MAG: hypothetical protein JXR37_11135 [Kiritimatiellae bacterium]|nr:hypothetical protein [Kiritimatiellia bacterium]
MRVHPRARCVRLLLPLLCAAPALALPLGSLVHDGPVTPEQISLYLPVTGSLDNAATASVRYRAASASAWTIAHPLHRIRSEFSETAVPDAFAAVITGRPLPVWGDRRGNSPDPIPPAPPDGLKTRQR